MLAGDPDRTRYFRDRACGQRPDGPQAPAPLGLTVPGDFGPDPSAIADDGAVDFGLDPSIRPPPDEIDAIDASRGQGSRPVAHEYLGLVLKWWVALITRTVPDFDRMTIDSVLAESPKNRTPSSR